jgi:hypothetical protein
MVTQIDGFAVTVEGNRRICTCPQGQVGHHCTHVDKMNTRLALLRRRPTPKKLRPS